MTPPNPQPRSVGLRDPDYGATRRAWQHIWTEEADVARELGTRDYPRSRQARERYLPFLSRSGAILEAGCGLGVEVLHLRHLGYRAIGLDYVEDALRRIDAYDPGHPLAAGDVHELPFRDGAFAGYLSFGVLEHFAFGPEPALREAHRVLQEGGIAVLTVPYPNLVWRLVRLRRRLVARREGDAYYETTYRVRALERALRRTGFDVLRRHPIGHSFTLWGLGAPFRGPAYYETSALAEHIGAACAAVLPWSTCFASLIVARKGPAEREGP